MAVLVCIPTNSVRGFPFLHTLSSILLLVDFWIAAILTGVKWFLIVVLICISLIMSDVDQQLLRCDISVIYFLVLPSFLFPYTGLKIFVILSIYIHC